MRTLIKWRFRLSLCPSEGVVVLGYKTLNFIFSFFLSSFLGKTITCCFKDTSSIIYSYELREFKEEDEVKEKTTKDDDGRRRKEKG